MIFMPTIILAIEDEDDRTFMVQLYLDYRWLMYKIAAEIVEDAQIAEDMVSQTVCDLIDALPVLRRINSCKLRSYVAIVVRNNSIDYVRRQNMQSKYLAFSEDDDLLNNVSDGGTIDDALIREAEIEELKRGLSKLSERDRTLLMMKYFDGAPDVDIAERLNIKAASVRTALTRARRRLCQCMKDGGEVENRL